MTNRQNYRPLRKNLGVLPAAAGLVAALTLSGQSSEATPDRSGRYVLVQDSTTITKIPVLKNVVAKTRSVVVLDLKEDNERLVGAGQLCRLSTSTNSSLVRTQFPPAFVKSLPPVTIQGQLVKKDGHTHLVQDSQIMVLGAKLKHPRSDSLPEEADDPRVFDQDRDGHPGMTVHVSGFVKGDVYVVQRSFTSFRGQETQDGFSGSVKLRTEQHIVGASNSFLKRGGQPEDDPSQSRFSLRRVPADFDCDKALSWAKSQP
jgi:hypothetical protein